MIKNSKMKNFIFLITQLSHSSSQFFMLFRQQKSLENKINIIIETRFDSYFDKWKTAQWWFEFNDNYLQNSKNDKIHLEVYAKIK